MKARFASLLAGVALFALSGSCVRSEASLPGKSESLFKSNPPSENLSFRDTVMSPENLSYYKDIKPIMTKNCVACHVKGGLAPFELTTYEQVQNRSRAIQYAVESRMMPPWSADKGHQDYRDDVSLSDESIATVSAWVKAGSKMGEVGDYLAPEVKPKQTYDTVISAFPEGVTYLPDQEWTDEYRCFVIPISEDLAKTPWVTGFTTIPGNAKIIHHLVAHTVDRDVLWAINQMDEDEDGLGYRCAGGALPDGISGLDVQEKLESIQPGIVNRLLNGTHWLSHWAPGMEDGVTLPKGLGLKLPIGSALILQIHYYTENAPGERDLGTKIAMKLASSVEKPAFYYPLTNMDWLLGLFNNSMIIDPYKEASYHVEATFDEIAQFGLASLGLDRKSVKNLEAHSANIHMHSIGKSGVATLAKLGQAEEETLLSISSWDLHWQHDYQFVRPKIVPKEDLGLWTRKLTCQYYNFNTFPVYGGPASTNEMCYDFALFAFDLNGSGERKK